MLFYLLSLFDKIKNLILQTESSKPKPDFFDSEFSDEELFTAALEQCSNLDESNISLTRTLQEDTNEKKQIKNEAESKTQAYDSVSLTINPGRETDPSSDDEPKRSRSTHPKERIRRVLFTSSDDDADTEIVDLTKSDGLIMGSDRSSEIDSLHSSDIDFIDDRVYEISSDENAKIRPKRCFFIYY